MATAPPYDWIENIQKLIVEHEEKPQFGRLPPFDWEGLKEKLMELFSTSSLDLKTEIKGWQSSSLKGNYFEAPLHCTPIQENCYFFVQKEEIKMLMAKMLGGIETADAVFYNPTWAQMFFNYLVAEILLIIKKLAWLPSLNWNLETTDTVTSASKEPVFIINFTMHLENSSFSAEIHLPNTFRQAWKKHLLQLPSQKEDFRRLSVPVEIALEAGFSQLNFKTWKNIRVGDFVILDNCTIDPAALDEAHVTFTLNNHSLFFGRLKSNQIKLTSYLNLEENQMAPNSYDDEDEDEDEEEDDLYGDLEEDEDFEEEVEEDDEEFAEETKPTSSLKKETFKQPTISPDEIPLRLTVEVSRIHLTVEELLNLAPGNLLDLKVSPEAGVDLVINGKKVGRGELVRMGEVLGVRIIDL